jgi:hypothetical protein
VVSSIADRFVNLNVHVGKASSPAPPVAVGETSNPNRCARLRFAPAANWRAHAALCKRAACPMKRNNKASVLRFP